MEMKQRSKTAYDRKQHEIIINVGDKVLVKDNKQKGKLQSKWMGPYSVTAIHDKFRARIYMHLHVFSE